MPQANKCILQASTCNSIGKKVCKDIKVIIIIIIMEDLPDS